LSICDECEYYSIWLAGTQVDLRTTGRSAPIPFTRVNECGRNYSQLKSAIRTPNLALQLNIATVRIEESRTATTATTSIMQHSVHVTRPCLTLYLSHLHAPPRPQIHHHSETHLSPMTPRRLLFLSLHGFVQLPMAFRRHPPRLAHWMGA
jgi:hypothetical protein